MRHREPTKAERHITRSLAADAARPLYSSIVDHWHPRTGRKIRPSTKKWAPDKLLAAVETYIKARPEQIWFAAETIASDLRARVDNVRHALHRLNLSGLMEQRSIGAPPHDTYRKRHGGSASYSCSYGHSGQRTSSGGWQASYYRRRDTSPPETPAERKAREADNMHSAFDDYSIQWALESQAAGYDGPVLIYGAHGGN